MGRTSSPVLRSAAGAMIGAGGAVLAGSVIAAMTALVLSFSYDFAGGDAWASLAGAIVLLPLTVGAMLIVPGVGCWWWLRRGDVPDARLTGVWTAVLMIVPVVAGFVVLNLRSIEHPVVLVTTEFVATGPIGAAARVATDTSRRTTLLGRLVPAAVITLTAGGLVLSTSLF